MIFVAKWALITGASSGLGEEFAWQLAAEPLNVVLVARRQDRLEALAQRIHTTLGVETEVLVEDLSTKAGQYAVIRRLRDDSRPVAVLVNNAGFGLGQTFVGGKWDREDEALEVMVRALCRLTFEGAQAMGSRTHRRAPGKVERLLQKLTGQPALGKASGGGVIINVSSATAYTAMGTYAAMKTWVRFFSEAVSTELRGTGVSITAVAPGLMKTEFHQSAQMNASVWPEYGFVDPETVVRAAIEAARHRRVLVTPTVRYKIAMAGARLAPRWLMRALFNSHLFSRALNPNPEPERNAN